MARRNVSYARTWRTRLLRTSEVPVVVGPVLYRSVVRTVLWTVVVAVVSGTRRPVVGPVLRSVVGPVVAAVVTGAVLRSVLWPVLRTVFGPVVTAVIAGTLRALSRFA